MLLFIIITSHHIIMSCLSSTLIMKKSQYPFMKNCKFSDKNLVKMDDEADFMPHYKDDQNQSTLPRKGKQGMHECPIPSCKWQEKNLKQHILTSHLPYWWIPHLACWNHGYSCHREARYQTYHGKVEGCTFHKCEQYVSKFMGFVNQLATYTI